MKKEPNKKLAGLFLIVGFTLFFALIGQTIWHKMMMDKEDILVMYFHESLQGLSEGAPVVFRGVQVGKVVRIKLIADVDDLEFQIPVYIRLNTAAVVKKDSIWEKLWKKDRLLESLIENGLRARLVTQSYLTGQLMIELVMLPDTKVSIVQEQTDEKFPQIPTVLSKTQEFAEGWNQLKIHQTLTKIDNIVEELQTQLPILLPAISKNAETLNNVLQKVENSTDETIFNANRTLQDISDAARSLQNLTDYLERHPEALIKGKKGQ